MSNGICLSQLPVYRILIREFLYFNLEVRNAPRFRLRQVVKDDLIVELWREIEDFLVFIQLCCQFFRGMRVNLNGVIDFRGRLDGIVRLGVF